MSVLEGETGNLDNAIKYCRKSLEFNPSNEKVRELLEVLLAKKFSKKIPKEGLIHSPEELGYEAFGESKDIISLATGLPVVEEKEGEYKVEDASERIAYGKTAEEAFSKYLQELMGKSEITHIPGRESLAVQDALTGRLQKYRSYVSEHPEILKEPPEVRVALFERDVFGKKVDIEKIRKKYSKC